jgi:hypothetical protein
MFIRTARNLYTVLQLYNNWRIFYSFSIHFLTATGPPTSVEVVELETAPIFRGLPRFGGSATAGGELATYGFTLSTDTRSLFFPTSTS